MASIVRDLKVGEAGYVEATSIGVGGGGDSWVDLEAEIHADPSGSRVRLELDPTGLAAESRPGAYPRVGSPPVSWLPIRWVLPSVARRTGHGR